MTKLRLLVLAAALAAPSGAAYAQTFLDFPPMQKGASFNLEALKQELEKKMQSHAAQ